ncbi:RluA family pseudouridine synthase [Helicobacter cholecystus]|uniref:RNA pseudouridylate synthase n=1 Tax=Helicobacter cholecystus TaxID=45498 RepID=A0A3D8IZJ6_9HELI|nr:RluA family pseudouridine synthase [Helicobacter cholecystus]RDU69971.1 RluA family pseudouridine synthase [Helicobacter cholecystus]VEJ24861.1 ribosomal pseudouridine synthase [Helicobacter cholecystus]
MEKAYKLLALQERISNAQAKTLIDRGLVSVNGKRLSIARGELSEKSIFVIEKVNKPEILFQDTNLLAVEKPAFIESYDLCKFFKDWSLLHRLDKETSGVILLIKEGSEFHKRAKEEFKKQNVYKEYLAIVNGILSEEVQINRPILTIKKGFAKSKISKDGLPALTLISPLQISGKKTLIQAVIKTGRTHQIRVHAQSINHPIFGDTLYGGSNAKRLMLHAHKIKLFNYEISSKMPKIFKDLMQ